MRILSLGQPTVGRPFEVRFIRGEGRVGQVIATLREVRLQHPGMVDQMAALLFEEIPRHGPPTNDPQRFRALGDGVFELKSWEREGRKRKAHGLRVLFFYDGDPERSRVIVCTYALKKQIPFPRHFKDRSVNLKASYEAAKTTKRLAVEFRKRMTKP